MSWTINLQFFSHGFVIIEEKPSYRQNIYESKYVLGNVFCSLILFQLFSKTSFSKRFILKYASSERLLSLYCLTIIYRVKI